jgi:hypothetical protein
MLTPLEVLEKSVRSCGVSANVTRDLFGAYGEFLTILADEKSRGTLAEFRATDSRTDATYKQVRKISETFEKGLDAMFFENPILAPLTRKYGGF